MTSSIITSENAVFFETVENHLSALNLDELNLLQTWIQNHHEKASSKESRPDISEESLNDHLPENIDQTLTLTFGDVNIDQMHAIKQKIHKTL